MALLTLQNIGKIYVSEGSVAVGIRGVNLSFERGEFVAVTGKSGSGKSTLLNVISGMDTYEEGELFIEGQSTSHYLQPDWEDYRQKYISFIFQDYNIIESFTVLQNVELALMHIPDRRERRRRAMELIERVGLKAHTRHKGSKLSGGQKQRTVIARALAKDSPIILADEPTGNLDSATSAEIIELLREVSREKLLIVVTHNFEEVEHCATRHVRIFDGAVESDTTASPPSPASKPPREVKSGKKPSNLKNGITLGLSMFTSRPRLSLFLCLLMLVGNLGIFFITSSSGEVKALFEDSTMFHYVEGRLILVKRSGEVMTEGELEQIAAEQGALSYLRFDRLLDEGRYRSYSDGFRLTLEYTYNQHFGDKILGRYPEARDEIFLYLPISCQPTFGETEILRKTMTLENLSFRVVGIKYFYDNNQPGKILFHREGFRTVTAIYSLLKQSNYKATVTVSNGANSYNTFVFDQIHPFFNMEGNSLYLSHRGYRTYLEVLKRKDPDAQPETAVQFTSTFYRYNYSYSGGDRQEIFQKLFTKEQLTDSDPGLPAIYAQEQLMNEYESSPHLVENYLAISAEYLTELGEEYLNSSYRQASLFFDSDQAAKAAAERLSAKGYIAVLSDATYIPDPYETILSTVAAILALLLWIAVILFIAFFINLCSYRTLSAFKGDMAIMRSMGISVRVIRIGMYVRMLVSLIPSYLFVAGLSVYIFRSPALNYQFTYLYLWQYGLIFLGMLLMTARVTRNQIRKLFGESVKKALKGGTAA